MTIEVKPDDNRTVEEAVAILQLNGYVVKGRIVGGKVFLVGVKK